MDIKLQIILRENEDDWLIMLYRAISSERKFYIKRELEAVNTVTVQYDVLQKVKRHDCDHFCCYGLV